MPEEVYVFSSILFDDIVGPSWKVLPERLAEQVKVRQMRSSEPLEPTSCRASMHLEKFHAYLLDLINLDACSICHDCSKKITCCSLSAMLGTGPCCMLQLWRA